MSQKFINDVVSFLENKTEKFKEYDGVTAQLLATDFDEMNAIFDVRRDILDEITDINDKLDKVISEIPEDEKSDITLIVKNYKVIGNGKYPEIEKNIKEQNYIKKSVAQKEKQLGEKLKSFKKDLDEQVLQINKNKQVIDYMDSTSKPELFKGKEFDEKL